MGQEFKLLARGRRRSPPRVLQGRLGEFERASGIGMDHGRSAVTDGAGLRGGQRAVEGAQSCVQGIRVLRQPRGIGECGGVTTGLTGSSSRG